MKIRNVSLQSRLIKTAMLSSIIAGGIALIFLVTFSVYQTMSLQDEIMDEMSDLLLSTNLRLNTGKQVDELGKEFSITYQLKLDDELLTQSKDYPTATTYYILSQHGDYAYVWRDYKLWRYYSVVDASRNMQVQIYQPLSERFDEFVESISLYSAGLFILWILQWGLLHFSIKKQLSSIKRLSHNIATKDANDLSPIENIQPEFVELQPILQQLNLLLSRLQHALIVEQRFTADAAHELRSPLSAMQMRLQVLERKHAGQLEALQPDLRAIQQDLGRGVKVLENLLLLARLDPTEQQQLVKQTFDFNQLVAEVLQSLEPFIAEKNILIQFNLQQQSTATSKMQVLAQREFLYICIRNLIDNAIRYSEVGGTVKINSSQTATESILLIEDQGQQLTEEVLARMGERFYRALGSKTQGSGLGLSISKKIVELHQGTITFSQAQTGGLIVQLCLPKTA